MTLAIEIEPSLMSRLEERARREHRSPSEWAKEVIAGQLDLASGEDDSAYALAMMDHALPLSGQPLTREELHDRAALR